MNALEIVLLVAGIICIIVSFFVGKEKETEPKEAEINIALDEKQKEHIRNEVDAIIEKQLENISDHTEAELEKLSSTKIMELGEYADTVFAEINRNHNEAMFLYDMLNEKTKDVKTTVKTINATKKQVEKLQQESGEKAEEKAQDGAETTPAKTVAKKTTTRTRTTKAAAKVQEGEAAANQEQAVVVEEEKPAPKKRGRKKKEEVPRNQKVLDMYNQGSDVKTIAKELGMGVGEVSLIIGLNKL